MELDRSNGESPVIVSESRLKVDSSRGHGDSWGRHENMWKRRLKRETEREGGKVEDDLDRNGEDGARSYGVADIYNGLCSSKN